MNNRGAACLLAAAGFIGLMYTGALDARQQAPRVDFTTKQSSAIRYLKVSNPGEDDRIGIGDPLVGVTLAISADGDTLAVGAILEDSSARGINGNQADNAAESSGAVYVFARTGTTWAHQAYVKASNAQGGDRFGFCLSPSGDGNTLAVCGYDEDGGATGVNGPQNEGAGGSGCAYVFVRRGAAWAQDAYVKASNTAPNAAMGSSVREDQRRLGTAGVGEAVQPGTL